MPVSAPPEPLRPADPRVSAADRGLSNAAQDTTRLWHPMRSPATIRTESLTKHYGDVKALVDLDLAINEGEVFGFLGPNGSGKTTTIRTLLDLIRPTAGRASIMGLDSHLDAVEIRQHIGYVPGDLALYQNLTGKQLITYFANLRGGVDWSRVNLLAERLDAVLNKRVGELSTGNRQKIALVQAFMSKPSVLVLDEPSIGLDPLVQRQFQAIIREAADEGGTVFLSSHTLSEVERVASRVGMIHTGRLVVVETIEALKEKAVRTVTMQFATPVAEAAFAAVAGIRDARVDGTQVTVAVEGSMAELLQVASSLGVVEMSSTESDLEEIFLTYYRDEGEGSEDAAR